MSRRIMLSVSSGRDPALARFRASSAVRALDAGAELLYTAIPSCSVPLYEALVRAKHPDVMFSYSTSVVRQPEPPVLGEIVEFPSGSVLGN